MSKARKYPGQLSDEEMGRLKEAGFEVECMYDTDPPLYGWVQGYARQGDWRARQPYRATKEQAWADAYAYHRGTMPLVPDADWTLV